MSLPKTIIANVRTNGKYGLVNPDDELTVGKDIDEAGAQRWLDNGIAKPGGLKKSKSEKPTEANTVKQIKAYLDEQEIEYDSTAKKADLLELV